MHTKSSFIFDLHLREGREALGINLAFQPQLICWYCLPMSLTWRAWEHCLQCLEVSRCTSRFRHYYPCFSGFHFLFLSARLLKYILQPLVALFSKLSWTAARSSCQRSKWLSHSPFSLWQDWEFTWGWGWVAKAQPSWTNQETTIKVPTRESVTHSQSPELSSAWRWRPVWDALVCSCRTT